MASEPLPVSKDVIDGAILLADAVSRAGVPYALIGGLAVGYWTELRFTRDVDCLLQVPQLKLPGLLDDLAARGVTIDQPTAIREWTQEHMTTLSFRNVLIDWLKPAIPLYQHVLDRAVEAKWLGHPVRVASAEGLILMKLLAYRTQDQFDIENLVDAHREALDLGWIRSEWATVAAADDPRMGRLVELVRKPGPNSLGR
jgi:hypothetical protein